MKITSLERQAHRRDRISVFVDDAYAFSVQDVIAAGLRPGQELSEAEVKRLKEQDETESGYSGALHYLSYRPRSEGEVARYLERKGLRPEQIQDVLNRLKRATLVDDQEFARLWVENREKFRPRGHRALRSELRRKGVDNRTINNAVENVDEEASAARAAERRVGHLAGLDRETFYRRLFSYLQRRGFDYGVSRRVVERLWDQVQAEQESASD